MFRRILGVLLCVFLLVSAAACGTQEEATSTQTPKPTTEDTETTAPAPDVQEEPEPAPEEPDTAPTVDEEEPAPSSFDVSPYMASEAPQDFYTLDEVGVIPANADYDVYDGILTSPVEEGITVYAGDGTPFPDTYLDVTPLGQDLFAVIDSTDGINHVGLVHLDGTALIPCEAAVIKWLTGSREGSQQRYLAVYYATEVTEDEDACLIYASDSLVSLGPDEDDPMYTGYGKIYDTKNRCFVGDLSLSVDTAYYSRACGGGIVISDGNLLQLYDETGAVLLETTDWADVGNGYLIVSRKGSDHVYNVKGEETYIGVDLISLESSSGYLTKLTEEGEILLDQTGAQVLPEAFPDIKWEKSGIVEVQLDDGTYALRTLDNQTLAAYSDDFTSISNGYFYAGDGQAYLLVGPTGVLIDQLEFVPTGLCIAEGDSAFVIGDMAFSLQLTGQSPSSMGTGLLTARSTETGLMGLFDLFSGAQLLPYNYEDMLFANGYLYAETSAGWEVYQAVLHSSVT